MRTAVAFPQQQPPYYVLRRRRADAERQSRRRFRQSNHWSDPEVEKVLAQDRPHKLSSASSADVISAGEELAKLNALFKSRGPSELSIRAEIRQAATRICDSISAEKSPSRDQIFQFADAIELLADLGSDEEVSLDEIRAQLGSLARFYDRDPIHLGRIIMKLGNVNRLLNPERERQQLAKGLFRYAFRILNGRRDLLKKSAPIVLLQAGLWDLRMRPFDPVHSEDYRARLLMHGADERLFLLYELSDEIATSSTMLDVARELTAHWTRLGDLTWATRWHDVHLRLNAAEKDQAAHMEPIQIRPRIELLLEEYRRGDERKRDEAIWLITSDYLARYEKDRRQLGYDQLRKWSGQFGLGLRPSPPIYESPVIFQIPRGRMIA